MGEPKIFLACDLLSRPRRPSMAADLLTVPPAASRAASPPLPLASIRACLPRLEALAALLLCLLASGLHLALCLRDYPLWRDEANAVQLATLPSFAETWKYLPFDSIPLGFHGLLRAWCAVLPGTDGSLRFLGLLIGLGISSVPAGFACEPLAAGCRCCRCCSWVSTPCSSATATRSGLTAWARCSPC